MELYGAAIATQADKTLALKVYAEQTDHELAKQVEVHGDAVLHQSQSQSQKQQLQEPVAMQLVCSAVKSCQKGTMGYVSALRSPAGAYLKDCVVVAMITDAATPHDFLHQVHGGIRLGLHTYSINCTAVHDCQCDSPPSPRELSRCQLCLMVPRP